MDMSFSATPPSSHQKELAWIDSNVATPWPVTTDSASSMKGNAPAWNAPRQHPGSSQQSQLAGWTQPITIPRGGGHRHEFAGGLHGGAAGMQVQHQVPPMFGRAASTASKSKGGHHPKGKSPRTRAPPKTDAVSYGTMYQKLHDMPKPVMEEELLKLFLRDELRSLLKRNGISYHKPGRANLMK
jgi:hypothetical protein